MDVRIASHHFPCFPIRRERPTVRRFLAQASQFGTLPMVCVPLWVASPADRPARTPRCVKSALEQGARQNCQELARSVPRPLQFVDVGGAARRLTSDRHPRQRPTVSRFLAQASQFGTLPMVCVPLWVASPADRPARTPRCVKSALGQGGKEALSRTSKLCTWAFTICGCWWRGAPPSF